MYDVCIYVPFYVQVLYIFVYTVCLYLNACMQVHQGGHCRLGLKHDTTSIHRLSRCLGQLHTALEQFSQQTGYHKPSGQHTAPKVSKDIRVVVEEL